MAGVAGVERDGRARPREAAAAPSLPADIAFLINHGFAPASLERAAREAERVGVAAHEVLIASGYASEFVYYRALAARLGLAFIDARAHRSAEATLEPTRLRLPRTLRLLPLVVAGDVAIALAPRGGEVEALMARRDRLALSHIPLTMTTPTALREAVLRDAGRPLVEAAIGALPRWRPDLSAQDTPARMRSVGRALLVGVAGLVGLGSLSLAALGAAVMLIGALGTALFGLGLTVRLAALSAPSTDAPSPRIDDRALPTYTILVPLYREAHMVRQLVRALQALDYPAAKLDILFLLEADDRATRQAIADSDPLGRFGVVVLPEGVPRTKPRALQLGLMLARGRLLTIFDAEDLPAPAQLRAAAAALLAGGPRLACVQARLVIELGNRQNDWLARQFALEYTAQFGVLVPGLAQRGWPILLGGTSNHFRVSALKAVGGWDAWNVTEDADLGIRLARSGFRVAALDADTSEEAPKDRATWLKQRRRWHKGFMQTALTHFTRTGRLAAELGLARGAALTGLLVTHIASTLAYPLATILVLGGAIASLVRGLSLTEGIAFTCGLVVFVAGHGVAVALIRLSARRARLSLRLGDLMCLPLYWNLVSLAAWGALRELAIRPFHWAKTEHVGHPGDIRHQLTAGWSSQLQASQDRRRMASPMTRSSIGAPVLRASSHSRRMP